MLFLFLLACSKGNVVYRETHARPARTIEVHSTGFWTRVESGEEGSNEAIGRSGCLDVTAFTRALKKARFQHAGGCDQRDTYEAPRRKKKACGPDLDPDTLALISLVAKATL